MPDPGSTRPDLCSIPAAAGQAEPAGAARGGLTADGHPPPGDDPPAPQASRIDRAIRLSTAAAVLAVAGVRQYVSYGHAYAVIRAHGETAGITARLERATIDGLVYASSMVVLYAARHRVPVPSLARWLLALGIAATLTANMTQGWSHGPVGAVVASQAVSLVGSYELLVWLIRTSGAAGRGPLAGHLRQSAPCRAAARPLPAPAADGDRAGRCERGTADLAGPAGQAAARSPVPPAGSVTMGRLRPPATPRRWPRTGSACRPATRCRNAGWPRSSDARPAAGREPESPMHGKHRRSQTRRAPRSRLNDLGEYAELPSGQIDQEVMAEARRLAGHWRGPSGADEST